MADENKNVNKDRPNVGGQAVLEGVMMRNGDRCSTAVRKEDGSINITNTEFRSVRKRAKILNFPIIRGAINFVEMMILSYKTLAISADALGIDEEAEETKFEKWLREKFGKGLLDVVMVISTVLGFALAFGLFFFLPSLTTKFIDGITGNKLGLFKNLIEGVIKILIFLIYIWAVSFMKDIRRTFEYHGAEHKSIFCYEAGEELTPENAKRFRRFHPRCGTSFIFVIMIISILLYSFPFVSWDNMLLRIGTKLLLLPIVVGIGYEFIMWAGKHMDNPVAKVLSAPGLLMQRITTKEPDESQLEVAIAALKASLGEEPEKTDFDKETDGGDAEETEEADTSDEIAGDEQ